MSRAVQAVNFHQRLKMLGKSLSRLPDVRIHVAKYVWLCFRLTIGARGRAGYLALGDKK